MPVGACPPVSRAPLTPPGFALWAAAVHTYQVIRLSAAAALAVFALSACTTGGADPSPAPTKPKDFCHAMAAAAESAKPASTDLDTLFTTIEDMAAASSEGDIDNLHTVGTAAVASAQEYAAALGTAASLAQPAVAADITTLQQYWTLYALGLAQVAETAESYGSLVDQTQALSTSEEASALIEEQPAAQGRINDAYLAECTG